MNRTSKEMQINRNSKEKQINRWQVVIGGVIVQFCMGALYTWSVFRNPIQEMFGWDTTQVSLAYTINLAMIPVMMIVAGRFVPKFGPTKMAIFGGAVLSAGLIIASQTTSLTMLYVGYGFLGGSGIGIAYGVPIATCVKWFPDKRGMITGLAVAGFGLGSVFWAPVAVILVGNYGPLNTFLIQAIYSIVGIIIGGSLMKAAPEGYKPPGWNPPAVKTGQIGPSKYDFTSREMLRTINYYYLLVMYAFANIAGLMIIAHASPIGQQVAGLTAMEAGSIVSLLALFNTFGRLFWGTISDKIGRTRVVFIMYVLSAAAMFGMNALNTFWLYGLGVAVIAFCFGGAMGTFPSIAADFYGPKHVGTNYGFIFLAYSIGAIVGPRLAAVIVENNNGDYKMAFMITGVLCSVGAVMALLARAPKEPAHSQVEVKAAGEFSK